MLARHLLFLATKRPNAPLLTIEPVPLHAVMQPPPYIPPPKPKEPTDEKVKDILNSARSQKIIEAEQEKKKAYEPHSPYLQDIYSQNAHRNLFDNDQPQFDRNRVLNYNEYLRRCEQQVVQMQNAKNQQYYPPEKDINQQFYTLPTRRPPREIEPPRSVTPDITRGLDRSSLSTMHVLARHGQKPIIQQNSKQFSSQADLRRKNLENVQGKGSLVHQQQYRPIVDVRNRFTTPLSLSALGYRFFASSPVHDPVMKSPGTDALKHNPISPIGHGYGNGFKSSTPTSRSMPTVAERLALTTGSNCSSPVPTSSGRSTPVQTSSGRSTPTNLILSPTKSTMSNEELFAAIHKSKKRLNIKDDSENLSPYGSMNSLVKAPTSQTGTQRHQKSSDVPQTIHSPSATSRLDFKRLLLQQTVKAGPTRVSAAEQLKLSRQQCQPQQQAPPLPVTPQMPLTKVLSPRSAWRFQTPRTDVLSSTIIEDTAAEEKAMKPSPENTSPISRLTSKRQLDLCPEYQERISTSFSESQSPNVPTNKVFQETSSTVVTSTPKLNIESETGFSVIMENRLTNTSVTEKNSHNQNLKASESVTTCSQNNPRITPTNPYLQNMKHLTPECQGAISAFESRRISNQLARAQFLASTPVTSNPEAAGFKKRFRARSESPQHNCAQNVARSPSAPTLETAL